MASREELMEQVRLKRLREQVAAKRAASETSVGNEGLDLQDVRGAGQSALSGLTASFADEIVGAARTGLDKLLPETEADRLSREITVGDDQSAADSYAMYRDDARASAREFAEENPGSALGLEIGGAILSPLNKVAPGLGTTGGTGARLAGSVARAAGEGALYGLGAGEGDIEDQLKSAATGAALGGGMAGALTGGGGLLGRAISKSRIKERLTDAAGNFKPIHLADPEGTVGQLYRSVVGGAFGGRGALGKQESKFLNKASKLARFADEGADLVEESVGTASELRRVKGSIDDAKRVAQDTAGVETRVLRKAAKAASRKADKDAANAIEGIAKASDAESAAIKNTARAASRKADDDASRALKVIQDSADTEDLATLNAEALRRSVPEGYADTITNIGTAGQRQAKDAINRAYNDAWGETLVAPKTIGGIQKIAREARKELTKKEKASLDRAMRGSSISPARQAESYTSFPAMNVAEGAASAPSIASDVLDRELRELLNTKTSKPMADAISKMRLSLRQGLPDEGQALLANADAAYPNYLATLRAGTSAGANARNGVFNAKELASGAKSAAGWRRAGLGESELLEATKPILRKSVQQANVAKQSADAAKKVKTATKQKVSDAAEKKIILKKSSAKQATDAAKRAKVAAKQQIADTAEKGVMLQKTKTKRAEQVARASKNRLEKASKGLLPETSTAWSQAAATAMLGAPFAMVGGLGALPVGAAVARGLASPTAQRAVVGQLPMQQALAKALREGDTAKYQRILARITAQQGTN